MSERAAPVVNIMRRLAILVLFGTMFTAFMSHFVQPPFLTRLIFIVATPIVALALIFLVRMVSQPVLVTLDAPVQLRSATCAVKFMFKLPNRRHLGLRLLGVLVGPLVLLFMTGILGLLLILGVLDIAEYARKCLASLQNFLLAIWPVPYIALHALVHQPLKVERSNDDKRCSSSVDY